MLGECGVCRRVGVLVGGVLWCVVGCARVKTKLCHLIHSWISRFGFIHTKPSNQTKLELENKFYVFFFFASLFLDALME